MGACLVTFAQISTLCAQELWAILKIPVEPISFKSAGWFRVLIDHYSDFVDWYAQVLWVSTHMLRLPSRKRQCDPDLTGSFRQRKYRRSHAGPRWKSLLQFILQEITLGYEYLGILLHPFFLHVTSPRKNYLVSCSRIQNYEQLEIGFGVFTIGLCRALAQPEPKFFGSAPKILDPKYLRRIHLAEILILSFLP